MHSEKKKSYSMDMCNGPILPKLLAFTIPLMFSSILQLLFNAADIVVVGKYAGDNALAAVGSNAALINLMTNFFLGLSIGANVLVARYFGAKEKKQAEDTIHTAMIISFVSGIFLTIVGVIFAREILIFMKTPEKVLPLSTLYLRIYFLGMTASMIYNFGSAILRAIGDTKRPLYYLTFAGVVNVLLNLLFVIKFEMGVAGVATATVISQMISAVLVVRCMILDPDVGLDIKKFNVTRDKLGKIFRIGIPASLQGTIFALSNVIIQASVNSFGDTILAGNSAAANVEGFIYVAMNAFYQGCLSFTSQNYGAGRNERINKILYTAQGCVIFVGLSLGTLANVFGRELLSFYTDSEDVISAGLRRLAVISATYALCGIMDVMVGSIRGLGYSVIPMIVSLVGACGLRLIWIFTYFRTERFHTLESLYFTYPISWIVTSSAHVICFIIIRKHMKKMQESQMKGYK